MTFNLKPTQLHDFIAEFFIHLGREMDFAENMTDKRAILREGKHYLLGAKSFFDLMANGNGKKSTDQESMLGLLEDTLKGGLEYIAEKESEMNRYQFLTKIEDHRKAYADYAVSGSAHQASNRSTVRGTIRERRRNRGRRASDQHGRRATDG